MKTHDRDDGLRADTIVEMSDTGVVATGYGS